MSFRGISFLLIIILSASGHIAIAQEDDYVVQEIRYENHVYKNDIRTIQFHADENELYYPFIRLNSEDKINLSFDDLSNEVKEYYYTIIHCDYAWIPENISPSEYIEGYREDRISDYKYSFNTVPSYIHYTLTFPNEVLRPEASGNYLLKVFIKTQDEELILTRRFLVFEDLVGIEARITQGSQPELRNYIQRPEFTIIQDRYRIDNPFSNLQVVILQNGRWDNAKREIKPTYVTDKELIYYPDAEKEFEGNNEFRNFSSKSLTFLNEKVQSVEKGEINTVKLAPEKKTAFQKYSNRRDINGGFVIRTDIGESTQADYNADYTWVQFTLEDPYPEPGRSVFVSGQFSDYTNYPWARLKPEPGSDGRILYTGKILMKQGFYDYQYAAYDTETRSMQSSAFEGSRFETENDYTFLVYNLEFGSSLYKLVGLKTINTVK